MSVELIDEQELVEALGPMRPDRAAFERGVQEYLRGRVELAEQDPFEELPPLARAAASVLPLPLFGVKAGAAPAAVGGIQKLLSGLLFPAVSLFLLLGATVYSVLGIRNVNWAGSSDSRASAEFQSAVSRWWHDHRLAGILLSVGTALLFFFGSSDAVFLLYLVSFGGLVEVVRNLAKQGLGNRQLLAACLLTPLLFLAQCTASILVGEGEIHFLDQRVVAIVYMIGVLVLIGVIARSPSLETNRFQRDARRTALKFMVVLFVPLMLWLASSLLWPATNASLRRHVEGFNRAKFASATWHEWEIAARWVIENGLEPNLDKPRALLAREIAGAQNPFILSSAFRTGLVQPEQVAQLRGLKEQRERLLGGPDSIWGDRSSVWVSGPLSSAEQQDWVIRALLLTGQLSDADRDHLAIRLHATIRQSLANEHFTFRELLVITQLLAAIGRPVQPEEYRQQMHEVLLARHETAAGWFLSSGGFQPYANSWGCDPQATEYAVELMQIYGVPVGMNANWIRSYAKPRALGMSSRWTNAVTLRRLAAIPEVRSPRWWEWLYFERNLLAASLLVGLCIYAVRLSPVVYPAEPQTG